MPSAGFLKFREVTGAFAAGVLTGIGANATAADVVGWLEIVHDQAANLTMPRLGAGFKARGDWFELGTTNGSAGQTFQVPTNGGGSTTHVPGVYIETGNGTGVYEWYPAFLVATGWSPTYIGTSQSAKFVESVGDGLIRIGSDGTNNVGYVPASGCKVRIPNIIGRQCATATRATNAAPHTTIGSRPEFTTTNAGVIDIDKMICDWYFNFANAYNVILQYVCVDCIILTSNNPNPLSIKYCCVGAISTTAAYALNCQTNVNGGLIEECKFVRYSSASSGYGAYFNNCAGTPSSPFLVKNCKFFVAIGAARSTSGYAAYVNNCANFKLENTGYYNSDCYVNACSDIVVKNIDHVDRVVGSTNTTTAVYVIRVALSKNVLVDGITFGENGALSDVHPYAGVVYTVNNLGGIRIRNAGTRTAPLSSGTANYPAYVWQGAGNEVDIKVQRLYVSATRTLPFTTPNTTKGVLVESIFGTLSQAQTMLSLDMNVKGIGASNTTTGQTAVYGSHWFDTFTSDTVGRVILAMNEPTNTTQGLVQVISGTPQFTSSGGLSIPAVGDQIVIEMDYFALGHTALANTAPTLSGTNTGNMTYEYQIDVNDGNGWNGSWKTLNATNLSGETISPVVGFKLKYRITCATANTGNLVTYIRITTASTAQAQTDNLYPLDYATISLSDFQVGTRIQIYDLDNGIELYNGVPSASPFIYSTPYVENVEVRIRAMYVTTSSAKKFVEFTDTLTENGLSRKIEQETDSVYVVNAIDGSTITDIEIDDANLLVKVDTGSISWARIYAFETYWLGTEEGIRDEGRFIEAIDPANYIVYNFKVKNVSSPSLPLALTGGWAVDGTTGKSIDLVDNTGGTIFNAPDHVVAYATSGGSGGGDATLANQTSMLSLLNLLKKMVDDNQALTVALR
jgi:hypothetical protein